jgi:hypothetical protein
MSTTTVDGVAAETPAAEEKKGILQLAAAAVASKASLIQERSELEARVAELVEDRDLALHSLADALNRCSDLEETLKTREGELDEIRTTLEKAAATQKTAEEKAVAIVAGLGVKAADEPKQLPETVKQGETLEELQAELNAETDPKRRFELAKKMNEQAGMLN